MNCVLGLDTSLTRAGVAALDLGPETGNTAALILLTDVGHGGSDADGYPQRRTRIRAQVHSLIRIITDLQTSHRIELAVIEGPLYGMKTLPSYFDRAILWGAICDWLDHQHIPIAVVPPATREKFITGVGSKGDKKRVLAEMRALWSPDAPRRIPNHDVADALGLATAGAIHLGWRMPFRLRRCHVENVALIAWPQTAEATAP
jgi:Holliday junction resolvasome RuvABC endonuclease subunit